MKIEGNVWIVGAGTSGKTSTGRMVAETHGHTYIPAYAPTNLTLEDAIRLGIPVVVEGVRDVALLRKHFRPDRDVFVILNIEGTYSADDINPFCQMELLMMEHVSSGRMKMEQYLGATFNSVTSRKLFEVRRKLGLDEAMRKRGVFKNDN